ncbi:DUF1062 domain-containing protein [Rhizobium sp. TH2]|uniref:DUF1062 domain-containing protein n=1 Tax=Rhizobium sp. TH2 TaxID=2775403 RepID=UPI0021586449|nr:DUF1062 domain-containing protein [Rhizobium sp. TH2]
MSNILNVKWTIIPTNTPQPWIACSGCGGPRPFKCSDKLRLNANGRRLDAWLIYKCTGCGKTWNRTLFERRNVRDIDPATLEALQGNDPNWIRGHAFDVGTLGRLVKRIDVFADCGIGKSVARDIEGWDVLHIGLSVPFTASPRLDRMLANELGLSRSRLQALHEASALRIEPDRKQALKRPARDGSRIVLDLPDAAERLSIGERAAGRSKAS